MHDGLLAQLVGSPRHAAAMVAVGGGKEGSLAKVLGKLIGGQVIEGAVGNVLAGQYRFLRQVGDVPPPLLCAEFVTAHAVEGERAVRMRVEPGARGQQTRLAGAGRSHQIDDLAALHSKGQVLEHRAFVVRRRLRGDDAGHGYGFEEGSHIHPV